ncbi:MAG: hypothetical protein HY315_04520, partial [Acidobacteria bacterium]|nr:hypothetical protein [Acidobacteriota bacterium]
MGYFGKCQTPTALWNLEEWTMRRLPSAIWKQWEGGKVRFAELRNRGVGDLPPREQELEKEAVRKLENWKFQNSLKNRFDIKQTRPRAGKAGSLQIPEFRRSWAFKKFKSPHKRGSVVKPCDTR